MQMGMKMKFWGLFGMPVLEILSLIKMNLMLVSRCKHANNTSKPLAAIQCLGELFNLLVTLSERD